ncbi:MAG: hypothetical protein FJ090_06440, partial [Deltaproteobacteria bacterium]|nr:hypothetical protein [Deltaproteobacteria bacterium]
SVRDAGGMQAAREALATEAWAARKALAGVEESPAREALDRLASALGRAA